MAWRVNTGGRMHIQRSSPRNRSFAHCGILLRKWRNRWDLSMGTIHLKRYVTRLSYWWWGVSGRREPEGGWCRRCVGLL